MADRRGFLLDGLARVSFALVAVAALGCGGETATAASPTEMAGPVGGGAGGTVAGGGAGARGGASSENGGTVSEGGGAGAQGLEPATRSERLALCDAGCPEPPGGANECMIRRETCVDECVEATDGLDAECTGCIASNATWSPSSCSSWECVCGGPVIANLWATSCDDGCAGPRQALIDAYEAEPRPPNSGREPIQTVDLPGLEFVREIALLDGGEIFIAGHVPQGGPSSLRSLGAMAFDVSLDVLWEWVDPAARDVGYLVPTAHLGDRVALAARLGGGSQLLWFDHTGFSGEVLREPDGAPLGLASLGESLLLTYQSSTHPYSNLLAVIDVDGSTTWSVPETLLEPLNEPSVVAVSVEGWTVAGPTEVGVGWMRLAAEPPSSPAGATPLWVYALTSDVTIRGLRTLPGGDVVLWGDRRETRDGIDDHFPYVAQFEVDGNVVREWDASPHVTPGSVAGVVTTASGLVCATGDESWELAPELLPTADPACNPDDCHVLVVRCFDESFSEVWNYHHGSEESFGRAILVDSTERIVVSATLVRDRQLSTGTRDVLMRFEP